MCSNNIHTYAYLSSIFALALSLLLSFSIYLSRYVWCVVRTCIFGYVYAYACIMYVLPICLLYACVWYVLQYIRCYVEKRTYELAHTQTLHSLSLSLCKINACSFYGFCWLFRLLLLLLLLLAFMIHKRCSPFLLWKKKKGVFLPYSWPVSVLVYCRHSLYSHIIFD